LPIVNGRRDPFDLPIVNGRRDPFDWRLKRGIHWAARTGRMSKVNLFTGNMTERVGHVNMFPVMVLTTHICVVFAKSVN
jgi:hypothetical protein